MVVSAGPRMPRGVTPDPDDPLECQQHVSSEDPGVHTSESSVAWTETIACWS